MQTPGPPQREFIKEEGTEKEEKDIEEEDDEMIPVDSPLPRKELFKSPTGAASSKDLPSQTNAPTGGTIEVEPYRMPASSSSMSQKIGAVASTVLSSQLTAATLFSGGANIDVAGLIGGLVGGTIGSYVLGSEVARRIVGGTGRMIEGLSSDIHFMPLSNFQRGQMIHRRFQGDELPILPSSETDRLQLEAWAKRERVQREYLEIAASQAQEQVQLAKGMLPSSPLDEQSASQQSSGKKGDEYEHAGLSVEELKRIKKIKAKRTSSKGTKN